MGVPSFPLEGRVAIVTGAASLRGMGRATALTFADAGADVAVCDISVKGEDFDLEGTAEEIRKLGRRSLAIQTDVSKESDVDNLVKKVMEELGTIDILVNNAGVSAHETLWEMTRELWDRAELRRKRPGGAGIQYRRQVDKASPDVGAGDVGSRT